MPSTRVMLIDDDELLRAALVEWLSDAGFHVVDFSGPQQAFGSSDGANPPDVLITDIDLGTTQNGFQVAAMAHELWPAVLVIVISAMPSDQAGRQLDPRDRYLRKPFSGTALLQQIEQLTSVPSQPLERRFDSSDLSTPSVATTASSSVVCSANAKAAS